MSRRREHPYVLDFRFRLYASYKPTPVLRRNLLLDSGVVCFLVIFRVRLGLGAQWVRVYDYWLGSDSGSVILKHLVGGAAGTVDGSRPPDACV